MCQATTVWRPDGRYGPLARRFVASAMSLGSLSPEAHQTIAIAMNQLVLRPRDYVTKLVSGLLTCKLPLDVNPVAIHATVPAPSLLAQASDVSDSAFS